MPPWAQTECERFTGTMESTSTWCPASASLIVVISPARPPPTTVNRAAAAMHRLLHCQEPGGRRPARIGKCAPRDTRGEPYRLDNLADFRRKSRNASDKPEPFTT